LVVSRSQPLGDARVIRNVDFSGVEGVRASVEGTSAWDVGSVQDGTARTRTEKTAEVGIRAASNAIDARDRSPDLSDENE
jgi:hypothetical protein